MAKIAMIGAGSVIFCKTLVNDILATPGLSGSEICLMSRTKPKLDRIEGFVRRMVSENGFKAKVWSTLDRREALKDAKYVILMVQVGGLDAFKLDYEIPLKYGVDQCIGDSLGPGGVFRALRTFPLLKDLVKDMEELCPGAIILNYANPMGANCLALAKISKAPYIGLCHGVQTTLDLISRYVDVPKDKVDYLCAGINHMAWFLELREKGSGRDLYPVLKKNVEKPEYYINEKVRAEVMRHFGYFMTESTGHLSEYLPWFRSSKRALETYCDQPGFGGASGAYYGYCAMLADKYKDVDYLKLESAKVEKRSVEYCSYILEAVETGVPFRLNGNVRNDGYITNLPDGCCVEVPVFVDSTGLHPARVGALPPQLAALNQSNLSVQNLAIEAAITGDPEYAMQAIAMDPLTSAVCTLDEVRRMTAELLSAQSEWLPQFKGRSLRAVPAVKIPAGITPVDVPTDPALAIANRFGVLAAQDVKAGKISKSESVKGKNRK